jgi:homoserine trans-succinylase
MNLHFAQRRLTGKKSVWTEYTFDEKRHLTEKKVGRRSFDRKFLCPKDHWTESRRRHLGNQTFFYSVVASKIRITFFHSNDEQGCYHLSKNTFSRMTFGQKPFRSNDHTENFWSGNHNHFNCFLLSLDE